MTITAEVATSKFDLNSCLDHNTMSNTAIPQDQDIGYSRNTQTNKEVFFCFIMCVLTSVLHGHNNYSHVFIAKKKGPRNYKLCYKKEKKHMRTSYVATIHDCNKMINGQKVR